MSSEQKKIYNEFRRFRIPEEITSVPVRELCRPPNKFRFQAPQEFVRAYMGPGQNHRGLLVYHGIGSGKTITAIHLAEAWKGRKKIIVCLPAFLVGNFYQELLGPATGGRYKTVEDTRKYYTVYSYQKFVSALHRLSLENTLVVIDEVQNVISESGVFYASILKKFSRAPVSFRLLLMSATPIFDQCREIALTLNLLPFEPKLPTGAEFDDRFIDEGRDGEAMLKNKGLLQSFFRGRVSYFKGMPDKAFPKMRLKVVSAEMSPFQYKTYRAALRNLGDTTATDRIRGRTLLRLPVSFFLGPRMVSNVAFPNGKGRRAGFESWHGSCLRRSSIKKYSVKFFKILTKLKSIPKDRKVFIYSNFTNYGGLMSLSSALDANGYHLWGTPRPSKTSRAYAIWSGKETPSLKEKIRVAYNDPDSDLNILLGSSAIREGVSLLRVEYVLLLEGHWNFSKLLQVIGRASRFCSHMDLPPKRRVVQVFLYLSVRPNEKDHANRRKILGRYSVDRYIMKLAVRKHRLISEFEGLLKGSSVDCLLNHPVESSVRCT